MKTFRGIICLLFAVLALHSHAQIINMNPDPAGDVWISGDAVAPLSYPSTNAIEFIPSAASRVTLLPPYRYNDTYEWFPPIFNQGGNACCVQAAEIWYTFTYEINRKRNLAIDTITETNLYHPLFAYNFLNEGKSSKYTEVESGFEIIKQNGCPPLSIYYDTCLDNYNKNYKYWMTDTDKYKQGMHNVISNIITFRFNNNAWLRNLKHWIADHGNGDSTGGLAVIAVNTAGWNINGVVPDNSPYHKLEKFISSLGTESGHALTIVGYNDDVYIQDINGDGQYTNDRDVNGDGIFDIRDFEKGAFKVANSWGENWNDSGYILIPYKHFYPSNRGFVIPYAYSCEVFPNGETPSPQLVVKVSIEHPVRNMLRVEVGYAQSASCTNAIIYTNYNIFNRQGGANKMRGVYDGALDLGLNFSYFYGNVEFGKIFLKIREDGPIWHSDGSIHSFSIIDYRWNEEFELPCLQTDIPIIKNGNTILSIDYHLIPHEDTIRINQRYGSNRVSRFEPTLTNGANMILYDSVVVDMYNSIITVGEGSTLGMYSGSKFVAKRGTNKIIINGDIQIAEGVSFIAEGDATLEIILNNPNKTVNFNNCYFENCQLTNNSSMMLNINNCTFKNCENITSKESASIENSNFTESTINFISNTYTFKSAIVKNCSIKNSAQDGIYINNFPRYIVDNNNIKGGDAGVRISNSGMRSAAFSELKNNSIDSANCGVEVYMSSGDILNNKIQNNLGTGVKLLNISTVKLLGTRNASGSCNNTQYFYNNTGPELYISGTSFPTLIRYNCFCHSNLNTPYVYYGDAQGSHLRDIRGNCWCGNVSNTPQYFYPTNIFEYNPVWCPTAVIPDPPNNPDRALYQSAENNEQNGNYSDAKTEYQSVVALYPETDFAQASLKKLLNLEEFAGNDYASLQTYYNNLTDSSLLKLSDILANKCNERLGNWQAAIDWYENVINNPPSFEDSIFSVIDLGYAHLMMNQQGGSRAAYMCTLPEHKPESEVQFFKKRNYLLSLLPGKESLKAVEEELPMTRLGEITDIVPNPASSNANVSFMLNNSGNVKLNIMRSVGKVVKIIEFGQREKGASQYGVDISELPSGMYLFKLTVDGNYCDTKKVIIAK